VTLLKVSEINLKGEGDFALKNIDFSQRKLERIAIAGETGSGKSSVLKAIAGLAQPDSGEVIFQNMRVIGPADKLVPGHDKIIYLSQHFELPKFLRVEQVLSYANTLTVERAKTLYDVCRISHLLERKTDQLSGGERQRIAIARLLSTNPDLLLLDEPFAHLDMENKSTMKSILWDISRKLKITCILVSHDPLDTLSWADKIIVMRDGAIVQMGTPENIYMQPTNEYVAGLFGKYNLISSKQAKVISKQMGIKSGDQSLFFRPENVKVGSTKRNNSIKGVVESIHFFGSYMELEISFSSVIIVAKTNALNFDIGDKVYLSVPKKSIWCM
jgi:iron(III) transport system ATP-binding protein